MGIPKMPKKSAIKIEKMDKYIVKENENENEDSDCVLTDGDEIDSDSEVEKTPDIFQNDHDDILNREKTINFNTDTVNGNDEEVVVGGDDDDEEEGELVTGEKEIEGDEEVLEVKEEEE